MIEIIKAEPGHARLLSTVATPAFLAAHLDSGPKRDLEVYAKRNYSITAFEHELKSIENSYFLLKHDGNVAGYSKVLINQEIPNTESENYAKLDRIYLLREFYGLQLGQKLLEFNIDFVKKKDQKGMWLYTWKGNKRAIAFYKKNGFKITGSFDFPISERHFNPNHLMTLQF